MCGACGEPDEDEPGERRKYTGRNWSGPFRKTPGRLIGMGFIRFYQLTFSGFVGNGCRHIPTCSEYGYEAFARHGFWSGFWLTLFRVGRCGPGGTSGLDQVPEMLGAGSRRFMPWALWRFGKKA